MTKKKIRFAIIGCGLMGREFASAAARWCHMTADIPAPEIVGVSDLNPNARQWFCDNFDTVKYSTADYTELLDKEDIDAVYCAVPHNLHEKIYIDIINAGKHLLGEKPFGIDAEANHAIMDAIKAHPEVIVRCSSEFPYYPACQKLIEWIREGKFGKIIEVRSAFCHSSDMDTQKPINWKRTLSINGEYGCMGDLGIHTEHVPFRMGWKPLNVFAKLSNIVTERPDGKGNVVPCETWDNAILLCDVKDVDGSIFPMMYETKRLSPGSTNEWRLEVYGLEASAKFSTNDPGAFCYTQSLGKEQAWCRVNVGYKPMIPTITGGIFEFGFTDSILQMWGAFMCELSGIEIPFGCVTPEETELSHKLQTAALLSNKTGRLVTIE
ncbi:MAG: Gfo/Idh/MocA family oxidoreductase [Clostridia bacterium]|nr:Gfo/Idh/MocA family oxidoreductase [Clostridia bacterium]